MKICRITNDLAKLERPELAVQAVVFDLEAEVSGLPWCERGSGDGSRGMQQMKSRLRTRGVPGLVFQRSAVSG